MTFTKDLKFSNHIARAANKGNSVTGAIRRSFRYMDKDMFSQLYKALIRGNLEYANTVWNPIKKGDADHLEKVQRRATKLVPDISFRQPGIYRVARPYRLKTYHKNRGLKSQDHTA